MVFSQRYKDLIDVGRGESKDYICGEIPFDIKSKIAETMLKFAEPAIIYPNRYDSFEVRTTAFEQAVQKLTEIIDFPTHPNSDFVCNTMENADASVIGSIFTPWLFDLIELQYNELSDGERPDFSSGINGLLQNNDIPWLLYDGRMIKIDAHQFELDLRAKALTKMHALKDNDPKFQAAFDELTNACEFFEKGNYAETVSNAGKSYESVLKVICGTRNGNADKLTREYTDKILRHLPATMNKDGFRDKVMMALPFIRNNSSADHGAGETPAVISKPLAKLAINISAAMNTYLLEEYSADIPIADAINSTRGVSNELPF